MKRKKQNAKQSVQAKDTGSFGQSFGDLLKQSGIETPKSSGKSKATPAPPPPPAEEPKATDPFDLTYNEKIVIRREKKGRGGKVVTVVRGLVLHADELMLFAQELRKQLGCGSSVEDADLIVQGDQRERIKVLLQAKGATKLVVS